MIDAGWCLSDLDAELSGILSEGPSSADFSRVLVLISERELVIQRVLETVNPSNGELLRKMRAAAESGPRLLQRLVRARRELAAELTNLERLRQSAASAGSVSVLG